MLYRYVFSLHVVGPFVLKTSQSQVIAHSSADTLRDLNVDFSTLVVEESERGPESQLFLDDVIPEVCFQWA